MHDKTLILESLEQLEELLESLLEATASITDVNELLKSADGMLRLNGICMNFLVIGEEFKKIDRYSDKQLLPQYPEIQWKNVIGLRDRIAHGYFEIDTDVIFDTLHNDMPPLLSVVKLMINDLS
jgi:uncharacterized protein with HEPN domain